VITHEKKYNLKGPIFCTIFSSSFQTSCNTCPYHQALLVFQSGNQLSRTRIQYYEKLLSEAFLITFPTCYWWRGVSGREIVFRVILLWSHWDSQSSEAFPPPLGGTGPLGFTAKINAESEEKSTQFVCHLHPVQYVKLNKDLFLKHLHEI